MDVSRMKSKAPRHQPACMVAHTMINKFSVIIGNCDLFLEDTEPDTQPEKRIRVIREVARTAVEELLEHLQQVEAETQRQIGESRLGILAPFRKAAETCQSWWIAQISTSHTTHARAKHTNQQSRRPLPDAADDCRDGPEPRNQQRGEPILMAIQSVNDAG